MNLDTQLYLYTWAQIAWVVGSVLWLLRRRDETPLVISGVLIYVFSFRFWAFLEGWAAPVDITPFGFDPMTFGDALAADGTTVLGQTFLLGVYMFTQNRRLSRGKVTAPVDLLNWMRPRVFWLATLSIPIVVLARRLTAAQTNAGKVMAFEVSAYLYELPFILISVAILLALLWKTGGLPEMAHKFAAAAILGVVAFLTFGPYGRFQFLGWVLAVTIIATAGDSSGKRAGKMALGFGAAVVLFAVAGAMRSADDDANLETDAWQRFAFAEDANMLDGMVLVLQVYPAMLPYSYGGEHLEILERPIPRALWPGKPVGGYMNKLGLTSVDTGFTLGISPGLIGSFYAEGGLIGVVICSVIYGYGLGWLIAGSDRITPLAGALIRAICCASLIPLLRGGDLAGIYAWIFMSFWPCFLLMWVRRRELFGPKRSGAFLPWRRRRVADRRPAYPRG